MSNQIEKKLTILVNSCDAYDDLWDPFFKLFSKFGEGLKNCQIILNCDHKKFSYDGLNIVCPNNYKTNQPWGKRVKNCLKHVKTDYVFFLIDDFFVQSKVDLSMFKKCIKWLDENKDVSCFNFISIESAQKESDKFKDFCLIDPNASYRYNAQAAIWRKEDLANSLLENESAWDWELLGNVRNSVINSKKQIYMLKYGIKSPYNYNFIQYEQSNKDNIVVISPVMKGKWAISVIDDCFRKNEIYIDYNKRGYYHNKKDNLLKRFFTKVKKLFHLKQTLAIRKQTSIEQEKKYKEFVLDEIEKYNNLNKNAK